MTTVLTKEEWYAKIKTFVPSWAWQREETIRAFCMALAKVCSEQQTMLKEHIDDTFILRAKRGVLDTHGEERSTSRLSEEVDPDFAIRVQNLFNQSNIPALQAFIDKILVAGTTRIQEDWNSVPFCDREFFCSRAALFLEEPIHNTFSIIVDKQTHAPYAYLDREFFCTREAFCGTDVSLDRVFDLILQIGNDNKALGTFFRIFELLE